MNWISNEFNILILIKLIRKSVFFGSKIGLFCENVKACLKLLDHSP